MSSTRARRDQSSGLFYCHYRRHCPRRTVIINAAILWALLATTPGCYFSKKSFPIDHGQTTRAETPANLPARQWLAGAHEKLKHLLPHHSKPPTLTSELSDRAGNPVNLISKYALKPDKLESIFVNFLGLSYSMQVVGADAGNTPAPHWPGFRDVWVPINADLKLAGRLGMARDANGKIISTDCIVLLPGLCGGNNITRQRDLAAALRTSGLHVLAVETRGQGQTAVRYPNIACTWGMFESHDLLLVSDWLEAMPHVKRTGLIGFSWGGAYALLTAWNEGRPEKHLSITPRVARVLPKLPRKRRYQAGVIGFSPVLDVEVLVEKLSKPQSYFIHPCRAGLQKTIRNWKIRRGFPNPTGTLNDLIRCKQLDYDSAYEDQVRFLRFCPYKGKPAGDKLASVRIPLLIVHAADDPIAPVQTLANLTAGLKNQNVATIILPSGGHIGFAAYTKNWFYSIILSFFDQTKGPKPTPHPQPTAKT
jgi:pimeloyl-ACP methyl ester carboxylesterase